MPALLAKLAPYLIAAVLAFGAGYKLCSLHWTAKYNAVLAADAKARAAGEAAVRSALQAQLAQAQSVSAHNAEVIDELNQKSQSLAADRDGFANRLRDATNRAAALGASLSKTQGELKSALASGSASLDAIASACAAVDAEDQSNADRLDALISQVKPQVE